MRQVRLDAIPVETFGSQEVLRVGEYAVSMLEGEYFCNCGFNTKQHSAPGPCRHILLAQIESLNREIELLRDQLTDYEEGTRKHRIRGMGASYKVNFSERYRIILQVLSEGGDGVGRSTIRKRLNKKGIYLTDTALGGRISESVGERQGWLRMNRDHEVVFDEDGFRYTNKKPIYFITPEGWEKLRL